MSDHEQMDIVIGGEDDPTEDFDMLKIMDSQIIVINECREWADELFDAMPEYRVKLAINAFKIILKCQKQLLDRL